MAQKTRENTPEENLEMDTDSAEMRVYELGFHLDPELSSEEARSTYQDIKNLISDNGTLETEGEPEKIQLAYTISRMETTGRRDFNSAYFAWVAYEAMGDGHETILEAARTNARIIRFIDVRTTKEAALHSAEMHEFYRSAPQPENSPVEEEGEAELDASLAEAGAA